MKKYLILTGLFLLGCSQKVDGSKMEVLNGYWQISKAVHANGDKKDYPINEIYDFYELNNKIGFHKKVTWQPDGTFLINDLADKVTVVDSVGFVFMRFVSKFGNHTERIEMISPTELVLETSDLSKLYFSKVVKK